MADLDLWIEGGHTDEPYFINIPIAFDHDRLFYDQLYTDRVDAHIKQALLHLAREVEEIGLQTPTADSYRHDRGLRDYPTYSAQSSVHRR